jgi:hypothetical protein
MEILESLQNDLLVDLMVIIDYAERNELTNTQQFLDFLDILNEVSVRY